MTTDIRDYTRAQDTDYGKCSHSNLNVLPIPITFSSNHVLFFRTEVSLLLKCRTEKIKYRCWYLTECCQCRKFFPSVYSNSWFSFFGAEWSETWDERRGIDDMKPRNTTVIGANISALEGGSAESSSYLADYKQRWCSVFYGHELAVSSDV